MNTRAEVTGRKPADDSYLDEVLWGAQAIGSEINMSARQFFHAAQHGHLDGYVTKVGPRKYCAVRRRLRELVNGTREVA
jgi:hypothetical protein